MDIENKLFDVSALASRDATVCRAAGGLVGNIEVLIDCDVSAEFMREKLRQMLDQFQKCKEIAYKAYEIEQSSSSAD